MLDNWDKTKLHIQMMAEGKYALEVSYTAMMTNTVIHDESRLAACVSALEDLKKIYAVCKELFPDLSTVRNAVCKEPRYSFVEKYEIFCQLLREGKCPVELSRSLLQLGEHTGTLLAYIDAKKIALSLLLMTRYSQYFKRWWNPELISTATLHKLPEYILDESARELYEPYLAAYMLSGRSIELDKTDCFYNTPITVLSTYLCFRYLGDKVQGSHMFSVERCTSH